MRGPASVIARLRLAGAVVVLAVTVSACGWIAQSVEIRSVSASEDGLTLEVEVAACDAEISVEVTEDDRSVGLFATARNGTDAGCTGRVTVELEMPLGVRVLIDGHDFTQLETGE